MRVLTKEEYAFLKEECSGACNACNDDGVYNDSQVNLGDNLQERGYVLTQPCEIMEGADHYLITGLGLEACRAYEAYHLMADLFA